VASVVFAKPGKHFLNLKCKISRHGKSWKNALALENWKSPGKWDVVVLEYYREDCAVELGFI